MGVSGISIVYPSLPDKPQNLGLPTVPMVDAHPTACRCVFPTQLMISPWSPWSSGIFHGFSHGFPLVFSWTVLVWWGFPMDFPCPRWIPLDPAGSRWGAPTAWAFQASPRDPVEPMGLGQLGHHLPTCQRPEATRGFKAKAVVLCKKKWIYLSTHVLSTCTPSYLYMLYMLYVYTYIYVYTYMSIYIYMYMYMYMYMYIYIYNIYIYILRMYIVAIFHFLSVIYIRGPANLSKLWARHQVVQPVYLHHQRSRCSSTCEPTRICLNI